MALTIKHTKVSTIPDGADTSLVRPSDWNADHALTGVADIAQGGTGGTTAQQALNNLLPAQTGQSGKVLGTDGTNPAWVASGGSSLIGQTQNVSPFETSLGFEAGNANTGANNTYVGYQAGKAVTGGTNNVAMGYQALDVSTLASNSVVIGSSAVSASTSCTQNVVIGQNAAGTTTTLGTDNTLVGYDAGRTLTGTSNVLIGSTSGNNATTVTGAVGIGVGCFGTITSAAAGAVAVGNQALGSLTTGAGNVALGSLAGTLATTGANNTLLGFEAGKSLITSNSNTFVGSRSGTLATAGNNTAVGSSSGSALTTGASNTFVGNGAGNIITTGSNNTIIGTFGGTIPAMSNQVIISDGAGNIRFTADGGGAIAFTSAFNYGAVNSVLVSRGASASPEWVSNPQVSVTSKTANYSIAVGDRVVFCNLTGGNFTVTLPTAVGYAGLMITVKRTDQAAGNTLTVASAGGQIEGLTTQSLGVSMGTTYCSDGTNWWEIANA